MDTSQSPRRKFFNNRDEADLFSPLPPSGTPDKQASEAEDDLDPYKHMSAAEIQYEKQSTLMELDRLKTQQRCALSREYTMQDNLADMKFEVRCQLSKIDEASTVKFMSDGMKLVCQGVELANNRWGPFLDLDGWAAAVTDDMGKYENSLAKLYRKYWKRSTMAPEMELAFGIIGSIALHHFKRKAAGAMFGGPSKPTKPPSSFQEATPMPFASANPRAPPPSFQIAPEVSPPPADDPPLPPHHEEEELPPDDLLNEPLVPDSVPISARKRLIFN